MPLKQITAGDISTQGASNGQVLTSNGTAIVWGAAAGGGLTTYANTSALPVSASNGAMAFVQTNNRLYIWNNTGWYSIAAINQTPTFSSVPANNVYLADLAYTTTVQATDVEGLPITYSYTINSGIANSAVSINATSGVFTANFAAANVTANISFTASDGVNLTTSTTIFYTFDQQFPYTSLLVKAVGSNTQQNYTFLDSSSSTASVTRNGDVTQGSFSPYAYPDGRWAAYFDGTDDYLTVNNNAAFDLGTGDCTIEAWIYLTSLPNIATVFSTFPTSGTITGYSFLINTSGYIVFDTFISGTEQAITVTSQALTTNSWNHIAYTRSSGTSRIFINGVSCTFSGSISQAINSGGNSIKIGYQGTTGFLYPLNGYISNVRVVKGTALYTSTFTPLTSPLTAISGTSLLTCQSNRFIDNSTNTFTITRNGDSKITTFSPFNPSTTYAANTTGGSAYFDGTGDYLTVPYTTSNFDWWTSDYTLEAWVYPTTLTGWSYVDGISKSTLIGNFDNTSTPNYWSFGPISDGTVRLFYWNGAAQSATSTATINANQWNHIAFTKTSGGITIFVNGVASSTTAISGTPTSSNTYPLVIGRANATAINGYVSNIRVVKGTAVYSGNFTLPTAPVTAITNTTLLLNATNAGIVDVARKFDLYTAGDVKVATNVFKYDKSLYFDGTGDYVYIPSTLINDQYQFGTGDFTVECWVRFADLSGNRMLVDAWVSGQSVSWQLYYSSTSTKIRWYVGSTTVVESTTTPVTNTWYHVAVARSGTTIRLFINGTLEATTTSHGTNYNYLAPLALGVQYSTLTNYLNGYMEDVRITKGYARYTATFTPPTAALIGS